MISNASDACEKLRHLQLTDSTISTDKPLEIHIKLDINNKTFKIIHSQIISHFFIIGIESISDIKNISNLLKN